MDTVGTLMLWRYLAQAGLHTTYYLTGNGGDETDIRVHSQNVKFDINVKTSAWQPNNDAVLPSRGHIAVKAVEFDKPLPDIYAQVIVHDRPINDTPHVHLCNFIAIDSEVFRNHAKRKDINEIPNTGGTKGLWIPSSDAMPVENMAGWFNSKQV